MSIKKSERERYFTEAEFRRLLAAAKALGNRHRIVILAGGTLGCRIGETVLLRHENFNELDQNIVKVRRLKRRENSPDCEVALNDEWVKEWKWVLSYDGPDRDPSSPWLLRSSHGDDQPICRRTAMRLFKEVLKKSRLPEKYSTHALRHYCGMTSWQTSKDLVYVQQQLGHMTTHCTGRYIHMSIEDRVKVARGIKR